jgi:hypothetical protein
MSNHPKWQYGGDELPPVEFRDRVAAAVHQAVQEVTGTDGRGLCGLYATAGAATLNVLSDGLMWVWQAGSFRVQATREGDCLAWDAERGGVRAFEYHAWIIRVHQRAKCNLGGIAAGEAVCLGDGSGAEVVDLTSRFYREHAAGIGLTWDMPEPPPYIWGWQNELHKEHRVALKPDARAMTEMITLRSDALWESVATRSLALFRASAKSGPLTRQQRRAMDRQMAKAERQQRNGARLTGGVR